MRRMVSVSLASMAVLLILTAGSAWGTGASISASGNEGAIQLRASANFTVYEECDSETPPNCRNVDTGTLKVYHDEDLIYQVSGSGSATFGTTLDGGSMAQGVHTFTATAIDSRGATTSGQTAVTIDNTPSVAVNSPGLVRGIFAVTGTAVFKDALSRSKGTVYAQIDSGPIRQMTFEGTDVSWDYCDLGGWTKPCFSAGDYYSQGEHIVKAWAVAKNGATSALATGSFIIDSTPTVTVNSPGLVKGTFEVKGTAHFSENLYGKEGTVYAQIDSGPIRQMTFEGTDVSWDYCDLGGWLKPCFSAGDYYSQGEHTIKAWATSGNGGISETVFGKFIIDNTPKVTFGNPGQVDRHSFDVFGTVEFVENLFGREGTLYLQTDNGPVRQRTYEGTSINWSYCNIAGWGPSCFVEGDYPPGEHILKAWAVASNGAQSEVVTGYFEFTRLQKDKNLGEGCGLCKVRTLTTGPINFATGNKYRREKDLDLGGPGLPLAFSRHYNSQSALNTLVGYGWTSSFSESLTFDNGKVILQQADGAAVHFVDDGHGKFVSETERVRVIEQVAGGYSLKEPDGKFLTFDESGELLRITDLNGNTQILTYSSGKVSSVEDNFGRRLELAYDSGNKLATLTTPIGLFTYTYDDQGNLTSVSRPDQTTRTYLYEDPNDVHNLTGIINEKGIRALTVQYDALDRGILSEGAGGTKRVTIAFDEDYVRRVTDSLGRTTTFKVHVEKGIARVKEVSGDGCGSCLGSLGEKYEFSDRLYVTQETDAQGVVTQSTYDERGNVLTKKEAVGTPEERTTTFTYPPTFDLVASITRESVANPGQNTTTTFSYDEKGNVLSRTESGFSGGTPVTRMTTYAYNALGQLTRIDGPRSDLNDVTLFEYYPNTPDQGLNRGRLKKITDAMGFETTFGQYNAFGKPGTGTDPNNVASTYSYDSMGRLKTRVADSLTTTFSYDEGGGLVFSRYPDGRELSYNYTDSGWLQKITAVPGSVNYIYDMEGNRAREEIKDLQGTVLRYTAFEYDGKNRLKKINYPGGNYEERSYDGKGNLVGVLDPKGQGTFYAYDPLSRLVSVTQPGSVVTSYGYDRQDNLIRVTDAENHPTVYTYDDLGGLVSTLSPDTNLTSYTYDPAGNLLSKTDANGVAAAYTYDGLNRLTRISFPDSMQNVSFTYDQGVNGKGRLTAMSDPSGNYTYVYDALGNLVTETRVTGGITFTTRYAYNQGGPLQSATYPSGRVVTYERDAAGRVIRVKDSMGGTTRTLSDNVSYLPFGPLKGLTYGNGVVETRGFDEMYRLTTLGAGSVMSLSYTHDPVGNILSISNLADPSRSQSFTYDSLERLVSAQGVYGTESYTYDKVGNRLTKTQNSQIENYAYIQGTNKIQVITGQSPVSFSYDANGNTVQMGEQGYTYNQDNRLVQAKLGGTVVGSYTYNGKGERTKKTAEGKTTLYVYDKDGSMISEADETGSIMREFVYLEGKLLSLISNEPPKDVEVRVTTSKGRKLSNINVYAFTQAGAYTGKSAKTDSQGLAVFKNGLLADENYKFRADYLSYQFWSPVIGVPGGNAADLVVEEASAALTVTVAGEAKPGVNVYLFNGSGAYLGLYQTSDSQGQVSFDLPVGKTFKFRADYLGSQYWSSVVTIQAGAQNAIAIATGGGSLTVSLKKDESTPIQGVKLYLFSQTGSYLGLWGTSGETGQVSYTLSGGQYKVRADYLGYQFWSDVVGVSGAAGLSFTIPHEDVEVIVQGDYAGESQPKADVPAYLFTSSGMYLNVTARTNGNGKVVFSLPQKEYKVRADYLGNQFWSEVFNWEDKTLLIREGMADLSVVNMGLPLQGVNIYAFTATGSYLNLHQLTDNQGKVSFRLPEGRYKFRADYMGSQYWSGDIVLIPGVQNPVPISTGGGAFTLKVEKSVGVPLVGAACYLFSGSGAYLSQQVVTSGAGEAGFNLADGSYKIRVDYLGYQYWTSTFTVPGQGSLSYTIPHQNVTMTVTGDYNGNVEPKTQINTDLFTASGAYVNLTAVTDAEGKVVFSVPPREYKVRADYLGAQYWSEVFIQTDKQVVISEGMADVLVNQNGTALANVNVYVFSASGSYLNLHAVTGPGGVASFRLPEGTYRFRGDYQGSQFWVTESIPGNQVKSVNLNTGGGLFTLRVEKSAGVALADEPVYVFTPSGSYLNLTAQTNAQGEVTFGLAAGWYRFRVDYMGYQFWCDALEVPSTLSYTMGIPHRESIVTVNTFYTGAMVPLEGMKSYLFTEAGSYLNVSETTDAQGQVKFSLPDQDYKLRVDYLGGQYWSEVFRWQDKEVVIDEGVVDLHVTWNGAEVSNAAVYLFTDTGSYLSKNATTDAQGHAKFTVPVKPYKFRIDYSGRQYWTSVITPIAHQQLSVEVPLEQLALIPTNDPQLSRYDGEPPVFVPEPVKVATIGSLMGILSQTVVAQTVQPKVYYYLTDHLGTPQKVMDNAGTVVWSGDYRPFGEVTSGVSTIQNQFRFPGQYYEKESGFHYNYHRYYQPRTGMYIGPDPTGIKRARNHLYAYAEGNPMRRIDPMGLYRKEIHEYNTTAWASAAGYSSCAAAEVGRSNQSVDEDTETDPMNASVQVLGLWHFPTKERIDKVVNNAYNTCRTSDLGKALHVVQDSYSHEGYSPYLGHGLASMRGKNPDDPTGDPAKTIRMAWHTREILEQFRARCGEEAEKCCGK